MGETSDTVRLTGFRWTYTVGYFARVPWRTTHPARLCLRRGPDEPADLPAVLGFYTLSMANVESARAATVLERKLPREFGFWTRTTRERPLRRKYDFVTLTGTACQRPTVVATGSGRARSRN